MKSRTRKGIGAPMAALLLLAVVGAGVVAQGQGINLPFLSGLTDGSGDQIKCDQIQIDASKDICGDTAELVLTAEELGTANTVTTTAYAVMSDGDVRTKQISGSSTTWSAFTVGEKIDKLFAGNESGFYPIDVKDVAVNSKRLTKTLEVADQVSTGNLQTDIRQDGDSDTSLDLVADEQDTIDKLRFTSNNANDYFNGYMVVVDYAQGSSDSNVTISNWEGATEAKVPDSVSSSYDDAFIVFDGVEGGVPVGEPFTDIDSTGPIQFEADSDDPSETVRFLFKDLNFYRDDAGVVKYGVEDEDNTDLGVSDVTQDLTIN